MELIRISERKLKIMLTPADMTQYEMDVETLGEDSMETRKSFRMLMKEVRRQIGFEIADQKISVQYFPSREGGCEMFVCSTPYTPEEKKRALIKPAPAGLPVKADRKRTTYQKEIVCRLENLPLLLAVCHRLHAIKFDGKSAAYRDENGRCHLFLTVRAPSPFRLPDELTFLSEYGEIGNASHSALYAGEHAALLSDKAVEDLGVL